MTDMIVDCVVDMLQTIQPVYREKNEEKQVTIALLSYQESKQKIWGTY